MWDGCPDAFSNATTEVRRLPRRRLTEGVLCMEKQHFGIGSSTANTCTSGVFVRQETRVAAEHGVRLGGDCKENRARRLALPWFFERMYKNGTTEECGEVYIPCVA